MKLKEEIERMMKAKGLICSEILEKQRKITSLEADSSTLAQVASDLSLCVCLLSHLMLHWLRFVKKSCMNLDI